MSLRGSRIMCMIWHGIPGLDLHYSDPVQPLTTAGEGLDDISVDR